MIHPHTVLLSGPYGDSPFTGRVSRIGRRQ
nr:MAG TPA: hypothetical protein [Caudoviricetes sp.]DAH72392.1 MAG TPA: hypothetical protein [Caudoviricetes sp.]